MPATCGRTHPGTPPGPSGRRRSPQLSHACRAATQPHVSELVRDPSKNRSASSSSITSWKPIAAATPLATRMGASRDAELKTLENDKPRAVGHVVHERQYPSRPHLVALAVALRKQEPVAAAGPVRLVEQPGPLPGVEPGEMDQIGLILGDLIDQLFERRVEGTVITS